jgi:serine/threonine protein kinase/tetratricopeptide (TPR) repeat protein
MRCATCGRETTSGDRCDVCGATLGGHTHFAADTATLPPPPAPLVEDPDLTRLTGGQAPREGRLPGSPLTPGAAFGSRYRITRLLGIGGMGAVYEAEDAELGVTVAIKVIRPETMADPIAAEQVEQRFKRELLLAREVTHKNVVRIHDLGEIDRIKYITMTYVDGEDLASILRARGKLPVREVVPLARQMAAGLEAAHEAGIVHRDLKPANVMVDQDGHALIMDFGIARLEGGGQAIDIAAAGRRRTTPAPATGTRTAGGRSGGARTPGAAVQNLSGATIAGAIVGTMDYMAPEQAQGQPADHRADIYAFGLILREMLVGVQRGHDALADLLARIQKGVQPLRSVDPSMPETLERIVARCTEVDPGARYQQTSELCADLNRLDDDGAPLPEPKRFTWKIVAAAVVFVSALAGGIIWLTRSTPPPKAHDPVSVLVADFDNRTGEAVFDDTLEPMFNVALEGASFLNTFNRRQARALAAKLPNSTNKLDKQAARLIAVSEGIDVVLIGSLSRGADGYRVSVQAVDGRTGKSIAAPEATVKTKDEVLHAIPRMVAPIRKALGDRTPEAAQLNAVGGAFAAASLEAVRLDAIAVELQFAGKAEEAFQAFKKAAEVDPSFARAYSGMAAMAGNLGRTQEAEQYITLAMKHVDRMTEREQYRFRGQYYLNTGDWHKCVEEYTQLMDRYPVDRVGQNNLASCLSNARRAPEAVAAARRAVELVPKGVGQRLNLAFISSFAGDFTAGEREARESLKLAPSLGLPFLSLAEAQLGQGQVQKAAESYRELEKSHASIAAAGLADLAAYEGRYGDAVRILQDGIAADVAAKAPGDAAGKWAALADVQLVRGQSRAAADAARKALAGSQSLGVRFLAARALVEAGDVRRAQATATEFDAKLTAEPQAYGRIITGMAALQSGDKPQAIKALSDAKGLLDTWIGRFELGRAYLAAGQFVQADAEFDRCIRRRGEAIELFLDNAPTYRFLPAAYYYEGRVREGLKAQGYAQFYQTYLGIRGQAGEDPLLPDIRKRLGQ